MARSVRRRAYLYSMAREDIATRRIVLAGALSIGAHVGIVAIAGALFLARALFSSGPSDRPMLARSSSHGGDLVDIDLPGMEDGSAITDSPSSPRVATPIPRGGGEGV